MIDAVHRRWAALDNWIKQVAFVGGTLTVLAYIAAVILGVSTGTWNALGALVALTGIAVVLGGLMWLATRLFPDKEN